MTKSATKSDPGVGLHNEQLAFIVERCLETEAAYQLFDMLGAISQLDMETKRQYLELVCEAGVYTPEEIHAIQRLIFSGGAQYLKEVIDQVRNERVQREIEALLAL